MSSQLMTAAAALLVVVLVAFVVPLALSTGHHSFDEARSDAITQSLLLGAQISDPVARAAGATAEQPHPGQVLATAVADTRRRTGLHVLVVDRSGRVLSATDHAARVGASATDADGSLRRLLAANPGSFTPLVQTRDGDLVVTVPVLEAGRMVGAVRVARAMSQVDRRTVRRNLGLAALALLALTIGTGVAALLATRLTNPLRRFELVARRFGEGDVDVRAPEPSGRELAALAGSFNTMADSITANMQAQRDFAANASHQLKTPLTALRLRLDSIADQTGVDPVGEARKALGDVARLDALVTDLLDLAHAETPVGFPEPFDLGELVSDVAERWTETATRRGKQLHVVIEVPAVVSAVEDDIEQVLDNLVDNAIRYSGRGAHITLEAVGAAARVGDDGPGIPDDERARVFERFFRGRTGRATAPGTGLGLAIVAALVRRSGGDVRLLESPGTRIEVRLPAA